MPYISIQTNRPLDLLAQNDLLSRVSRSTAEILEKPESYVMVAIMPATAMMFAGSDAPTAFVTLKSLGLPEDQTVNLSRSLCQLVSATLGIQNDRIYIEFASPARHLWGWNESTF
jgi:phenylpyruvate tautomerase PptA (4-oxalocrotonate tautomerase family)